MADLKKEVTYGDGTKEDVLYDDQGAPDGSNGIMQLVLAQLRDTNDTAIDPATQPTVQEIVDGLGAIGDAAETDETADATSVALLKGIVQLLKSTLTVTDDGALAISALPNVTIGGQTSDLTITLDGEAVSIGSLPNVTIGSQTAGLAQDSTLQSQSSYASEPVAFDPSSSAQTPGTVFDAIMLVDGSNPTRTIELKATNGGSLQTVTLPTNAIIPMQVAETGTSGNATSAIAFRQ
jgi:hypothetical protein